MVQKIKYERYYLDFRNFNSTQSTFIATDLAMSERYFRTEKINCINVKDLIKRLKNYK